MPIGIAKRPPAYARQKGAEIVEFLITLPVILIVVAILFDFGALLSDQIILTNAARVAAREVISGASDAEAQAASDQITQSLLSSNTPTITVVRAGSGAPGDQVTVTVNHVYTFLLLPGFTSTAADFNLVATARMNMLPN